MSDTKDTDEATRERLRAYLARRVWLLPEPCEFVVLAWHKSEISAHIAELEGARAKVMEGAEPGFEKAIDVLCLRETNDERKRAVAAELEWLRDVERTARRLGYEDGHNAAIREHADELEELPRLRAEMAIVRTHTDGVWFWQGDGHDQAESLTCPVVMSAEKLRELLTCAGCRIDGKPCAEHEGVVHGKEAEEMRAGIEEILKKPFSDVDLVRLLDRVNARDSLAYLEALDRTPAQAEPQDEGVGVAGDRCCAGNECGRTGCPNCQD